MKKILVPTDFSPVADNALQYAIDLAAIFKSELYLYHVYSFDSFNYDQNFPKYDQPYTKEVMLEMERTELKFKDTVAEKELKLRTFVEEETFFSLFKIKVVTHHIDMILMGSKGASGMTKVFFGSVAATALDMAKVPVLIVPPDHTFQRNGKIVLALDQEIALNVLSPLQKLASVLGAKVTVLHVETASNKYVDKLSDLEIDGVETTFRAVTMTKSINETIDQFIREEGGNLLCMIRREKGIFKSLFHKSVVKTQVFSNQIPLLVLPEV